jgi:hypothetical protein
VFPAISHLPAFTPRNGALALSMSPFRSSFLRIMGWFRPCLPANSDHFSSRQIPCPIVTVPLCRFAFLHPPASAHCKPLPLLEPRALLHQFQYLVHQQPIYFDFARTFNYVHHYKIIRESHRCHPPRISIWCIGCISAIAHRDQAQA